MRLINAVLVSGSLLFAQFASASYIENAEVGRFIDQMVEKHAFDKTELQAIFSKASKQDHIIKLISKPAEKRLKWHEYRNIFLKEKRIANGVLFVDQFRHDLERAEQKYGVPIHIIAAIIGVETWYGKIKGKDGVVDALSTLAFDYPPRSKFFRGELESLLLLSREQGFDPLSLKGSYAGAMGYGQFIPSSYRHYAVDFDGDKIADIIDNPIDAIGSVANYFVRHKWKTGEPVAFKTSVSGKTDDLLTKSLKPATELRRLKEAGVVVPEDFDLNQKSKLQPLELANGMEHWVTLHNFYVITRYNHSHMYAMAVYQLSEEIKQRLK